MPHVTCLKLGLDGGSSHGADGLHESETGILDVLDLLVLLLVGLLVLLLKLGHEVGEFLLGGGDFVFLSLDLLIQQLLAELLELRDSRLRFVIAQVQIVDTTLGLEVLRSELMEILESAAAFVILETVGVTVLKGGESLDAVGIAKRLTFSCAIDLSHKGGVAIGVLRREGVPGRGHGLTMSTPGGIHLEENGLAGGHFIPIVRGQMHGGGAGGENSETTHDESECKGLTL